MIHPNRTPLYREEDHYLLGFILYDGTGWQAQTIFGYVIARTTSETEAHRVLHEQGEAIMQGVWQYFDDDDKQWHPCVIKDAKEHRVTVLRTNEMGYLEPDMHKMYIVKEPSDNTLVKS